MDHIHSNTIEDVRIPGRHLSLEERGMIQAKVVHLSRQKIRYFLMNFMLLHNQLTRLDNTSQPAYDGGWKNGFVQNCKCGYSA